MGFRVNGLDSYVADPRRGMARLRLHPVVSPDGGSQRLACFRPAAGSELGDSQRQPPTGAVRQEISRLLQQWHGLPRSTLTLARRGSAGPRRWCALRSSRNPSVEVELHPQQFYYVRVRARHAQYHVRAIYGVQPRLPPPSIVRDTQALGSGTDCRVGFVGSLCLAAQVLDRHTVHLLEDFLGDRFELRKDWRSFVKGQAGGDRDVCGVDDVSRPGRWPPTDQRP